MSVLFWCKVGDFWIKKVAIYTLIINKLQTFRRKTISFYCYFISVCKLFLTYFNDNLTGLLTFFINIAKCLIIKMIVIPTAYKWLSINRLRYRETLVRL